MSDNEEFVIQDIILLVQSYLKLLASQGLIRALASYPRQYSNNLYRLYNLDRFYRELAWEIMVDISNPKIKERLKDTLKGYQESVDEALNMCWELRDKLIKIRYTMPDCNFSTLPSFDQSSDPVRLYFNIDPRYIHIVVRKILDLFEEYLKIKDFPNCSFKFWSRPSIGELVRCDKAVLYCFNNNFLNFFLSNINIIEPYMNEDVPRLAQKIGRGIGFAKEPSEENIRWADVQVSFGSFICLVIQRYLHRLYLRNKQAIDGKAAEYKSLFDKGRHQNINILSDEQARMIAERIYDELKRVHKYKFIL